MIRNIFPQSIFYVRGWFFFIPSKSMLYLYWTQQLNIFQLQLIADDVGQCKAFSAQANQTWVNTHIAYYTRTLPLFKHIGFSYPHVFLLLMMNFNCFFLWLFFPQKRWQSILFIVNYWCKTCVTNFILFKIIKKCPIMLEHS